VTWSGCHATLVTSEEHAIFESFYSPSRNTIYIGTMPEISSADSALVIVAHEITHCLQHQENPNMLETYTEDPTVFELDADRGSADLLCSIHINGPKLAHDLFVWVKKTYGYNGDDQHGTLEERISQGLKAEHCKIRTEAS
jgi:hypothetical protein